MTLLIRPLKSQTQTQMTPQRELTVRRATLEDAPALLNIYSQPTILENTGMEPLATLEDITGWITNIGADSYLMVACEYKRVLGALLLKTHTHLALRHTGHIARVAVDPECQRGGVGSRLMTAAVDLADNWLNLYRLELLVRSDNPAAVHLYKKFGFREEGLLRGYGYRNGVFLDVLAMARLRGPLAR